MVRVEGQCQQVLGLGLVRTELGLDEGRTKNSEHRCVRGVYPNGDVWYYEGAQTVERIVTGSSCILMESWTITRV